MITDNLRYIIFTFESLPYIQFRIRSFGHLIMMGHAVDNLLFRGVPLRV